MEQTTDQNAVSLTTRNADLNDMVELLRTQQAAKTDHVVAASALAALGGQMLVHGAGIELSPDGVTTSDLTLAPTRTADNGIADKLGIPAAYLRRTREQNIDLYDDNVNGWLSHQPDRRFLVRGLANGDGRHGVMRALLSDRYRPIENLDVLMTCLNGIREAGHPVDIVSADLSESRMYVKIRSTAVATMAPALLTGYTSPFSGERGADNPTVFAGFVLTNSETGQGKFRLIPQLTVQICNNGMTLTKQAIDEVHAGGRLEHGQIDWSSDTQAASLALARKMTRDAVGKFLDPVWVAARIAEIEADAGVEVTQPQQTIEHVSKKLRFSTAAQDSILTHFIRGGAPTSGGVLHAVTAAAQTIPDVDEAYEVESRGIEAMQLSATFAAAAR
ncbi:hypothetical protein AD017_32905 (plasmid) [Pseudonocardia sp. EC080619-01]|uniref:hypothetical protein n=1 Tax=Pseudonocardia sp. EC080619-01 TaxID=1096856 RepID=UPI0007058C44|nr:hypothetical protein [Pseudonocardia sp. EC080619-01]ALL85901.1 hypothetical protein AD017_32905 [Pseudonocardia sp. EC080619-01]